MIKLKVDGIKDFISEEELNKYLQKADEAFHTLVNGTGAGNDFIGWVNYPHNIDHEIVSKVLAASAEIKSRDEYLLVIGIGGSYLGAKAVIDLLTNYYNDNQTKVIFLGNTLSSSYTYEVLKFLEDKDFSINVISKSGTTTESAIAFRLARKLLYEKYGQDASARIYVTTDAAKGALYQMSVENNYQRFVIPDDIGGRYSVLTPVGLLPIAVSNIDINKLLNGAKNAQMDLTKLPASTNPALQYAAIRNVLYQEHDKQIEILASFEPSFRFFGEWWKQLFGESEGKDHLGIFPASIIYSADLHSMGQLIQDGQRNLFETIVSIDKPRFDLEIVSDEENLDELNYLTNFSLAEVNEIARQGTTIAHIDGGVPLIEINIPQIEPESIGYLLYFFMLSCGVSGYMLGVNPFNQEGVEDYKRNMFALLRKPGFEDLTGKLLKRLKK